MSKIKKIAVLGAGFVTKPAVDYFLDRLQYEVIVTSLKKSEAETIIKGRTGGKAVEWSQDQAEILDSIVGEVDLVLSMIPPTMHIPVAKACLKHRKNMVTTSYVSPAMAALHEEAIDRDILILNEIGEDPGLDNMRAKQMIDHIEAQGGTIKSITSYGAGLPAFDHNNNPFGYKFSWSPRGVILAARSPAAYLVEGNKIEVPADNLFDHPRVVELEGLGVFEAYPNRDSSDYLRDFGLDSDVSLYRGILRYKGWCEIMNSLAALHLFDIKSEKDFLGQTYAELIASFIGVDPSSDILKRTAEFLNLKSDSDLIGKLKWIGLFDDKAIAISKGTNGDVLVDLMMKKMSYGQHEKDMVIVHAEIVAEFSGRIEKRFSTLMVEGEVGGDTAMSRAVSLPAALASKLILEGDITAKGVQRPTIPEIYQPVLHKMGEFGYAFIDKTEKYSLLENG
jgi:saccharopine dehydrogenase-like NADP-dependent oxidoreductase